METRNMFKNTRFGESKRISVRLSAQVSRTVFKNRKIQNYFSRFSKYMNEEMVMRQFGPNTKFGPEGDSDRRQIRAKILVTSIL